MPETPSSTNPSELVERLRWSAASTEVCDDLAPYGRLLDEAANEIGRMKRRIDELENFINGLSINCKGILRSALNDGDA